MANSTFKLLAAVLYTSTLLLCVFTGSSSKPELAASEWLSYPLISQLNDSFNLSINALDRVFDLILERDRSTFSENIESVFNGAAQPLYTSHLYQGTVKGDKKSQVYGFINTGIFQGKIILSNGTGYVLERKENWHHKLTPTNQHAHSIIYRLPDSRTEGNHRDRTGQSNSRARRSTGYSGQKMGAKFYSVDTQSSLPKIKVNWTELESNHFPHHNVTSRPNVATERRHSTRFRRQSQDELTCSIQMVGDALLWKSYARNIEDLYLIKSEIIGLFQVLVSGLNGVLLPGSFNFQSGAVPRSLRFQITKIEIYDDIECQRSSVLRRHVCPGPVDEVNLLNTFSIWPGGNHSNFCHSHLVTARNFGEGTVGLAWVGNAESSGICKSDYDAGSKVNKYYNTGLTSILNFGDIPLPLTRIKLVFIHEVGHNLGAAHDDLKDKNCAPGGTDGNYIMHPISPDGTLNNHYRFSQCSIESIKAVLDARTRTDNSCLEFDGEVCGNSIVDPGEECDCGFTENCSPCCKGKTKNKRTECKLTDLAVCDPSQGLCCTSSCDRSTRTTVCRPAGECTMETRCDGANSTCPASRPKADRTPCYSNTRICINGACTGSLCSLIPGRTKWQECDNRLEPCAVSCARLSFDGITQSSCMTLSALRKIYVLSADIPDGNISKAPGSPCNNSAGYCDTQLVCRAFNAQGPLGRLANLLFSKRSFTILQEYMQRNWHVLLVLVILIILSMITFVRLFAVYVPTNSKLPHCMEGQFAVGRSEADQLRMLTLRKEDMLRRALKELKSKETESLQLHMEFDADQAIDTVLKDLLQKPINDVAALNKIKYGAKQTHRPTVTGNLPTGSFASFKPEWSAAVGKSAWPVQSHSFQFRAPQAGGIRQAAPGVSGQGAARMTRPQSKLVDMKQRLAAGSTPNDLYWKNMRQAGMTPKDLSSQMLEKERQGLINLQFHDDTYFGEKVAEYTVFDVGENKGDRMVYPEIEYFETEGAKTATVEDSSTFQKRKRRM